MGRWSISKIILAFRRSAISFLITTRNPQRTCIHHPLQPPPSCRYWDLQVSITSPALLPLPLAFRAPAGRVFANWSGGPRERATVTLNCTEIFMEQCIKLRATDVPLPRDKGGGGGCSLPHPPSAPLLSNCEDVVACTPGREVSRVLPSQRRDPARFSSDLKL